MTEVMTGMKLWFGVELAKLIECVVVFLVVALSYGTYFLYLKYFDNDM